MSNYIVSGYSSIGKSHENEGIKCQDNCYFGSKDNIIVAAVGDGVSSSKHSDIASRIAVKLITWYCLEKIRKFDSPNKIINILREGFKRALYKIKQISNNVPNDYHTTLTVAVIINEILYFGQIGDSGIIALCGDGNFVRVTAEQNAEGIGKDRPVYPLAEVSKWCFGRYNHKIKAAFLATDGVLKKIQPSLLGGQKYNLNHNYLCYVFNKLYSACDEKSAQQFVQDEVENMLPEEVDFDDKTLAVVINKNAVFKPQSKDYYQFPSNELWMHLLKEYEEKLYPYKRNEEKKSIEKKIVIKEDLANNSSLNRSEVELINDTRNRPIRQKNDSEVKEKILKKKLMANIILPLCLCIIVEALLIALLIIWRFPVF